ncbi:ferrochelatase [Mucilaginibacter sp. SG564]|uniref:ferrochelatase n=1 Tax=Mucilaginibacter sp. SG564 TaxID=2587022 RepID=UPI00155702F1|nr:ferrochelatase [Mucilaginibacter sp. SG564]NOW95405.1 protoheme ferro-lyase [Mucilaginibacter sp. SG564]
MRKELLLVNLGTPDSPAVGDIRKYPAEFLMDKRVIDVHPFLRFQLARGGHCVFSRNKICWALPAGLE